MRPLVMFMCALSFLPYTIMAQWQKVVEPQGFADINSIAFINPYVIASVENVGLYRSTSMGLNWEFIPHSHATTLVAVDGLLYSLGGLAVSSDYGTTWKTIEKGLSAPRVNGITGKGKELYCSVYAGSMELGGIHYSSDGGDNWIPINTGLTNFVKDVAFIDSVLFTTNNNVVFRSTDKGKSWVSTAGTGWKFKVVGTTLFTLGATKIDRTTDRGNTWTTYEVPTKELLVDFSIVGNNIYALAGTGLYHSSNNGSTWVFRPKTYLPRHQQPFHQTMVVNGPDILLGAREFGIVHSTDHGATISRRSTGIEFPYRYSIFASDAKPNSIYVSLERNLFHSSDNGNTWYNPDSLLPTVPSHFLIDNDSLYLSGAGINLMDDTTEGYYISTDPVSRQWKKMFYGIYGYRHNFFSSYKFGQTMFAFNVGYSYGVWISYDNGKTWSGYNEGGRPAAFAMIQNGKDYFIADGTIRISVDGGKHYSLRMNGIANTLVRSIAQIGINLYAISDAGYVHRSIDNGANWTIVSQNIGEQVFGDMLVYGSMILFSGTKGVYMFNTTNNSITNFSQGLPVLDLEEQVILRKSGPILFLKYGNDLWRRNISEITSISEHRIIPEHSSIEVHQNYPNPFNPTTTIKFGLPEAGNVTLKIYDALGREVATLVNNQLTAGYYSYEWNAGHLASGVYIYRMTAVSSNDKAKPFNEVKKLLLMK
ncbi:MAG: T9SS type A sorting domain-containing protein [Bacteroidota bacterium]